jgi:hypothetical protein
LFSGCLLLLAGCGKATSPQSTDKASKVVESTALRSATKPVEDEGWLRLFDGKTMTGWESKGQVSVVDGALVLTGVEKETSCMTEKKWGEHELRFEYRFQGKQAPILFNSEFDKQFRMTTYPGTGLPRSSLVEWWACTAKLQEDAKTGNWRWSVKARPLASVASGTGEISKGKNDTQPAQIGFRVSPGDTLTVRNLMLKPLK